ncbi:SRC kinase signaling inhibitor 1 isoform X3 [Denticeps clupeoides]|uniref:Actin interacting protein 3-like C-terminal domain-containing protein n=1 Tax=Denticeps clupeoides TaxID=299321 RepID=A0AAY3ZZG5_9TELE|nr:SRC kinase signaling inhibitor 1-like isoform X3 [Denticeps clupeoides]
MHAYVKCRRGRGDETHCSTAGPFRKKSSMISAGDAEFPRDYHTLGSANRRFSSSGLIHTSARSLEALTNLQKAEMDALNKLHKVDGERQRDAQFKNKYPPQHAATLVNTNCSRQQQQPNYWSFKARTPRQIQASPCSLPDQTGRVSFASAESLETMSESDVPLGFNRMNRLRQSLPLARSPSQTKLRAPGVLILQFGDETRRVHITHELTSMETLHALIVHMFPQKLTMNALRSPSTAILIKDEARNVFYELEDPRDIQDRCIIKIYCREAAHREAHYATHTPQHTPQHAHHAHIANGDLRRELVYSSRDSSPTQRLTPLPSASPPSGSPSRSHARLSYAGGRPSSYAGTPHSQPHPYPHHPAHGLGNNPQLQQPPQGPAHGHGGFCPSPSAILERRDVKPDEEMTSSSKSVVLLKNESIYADPYALVHEGCLSIASPQALAAMRDPLYRRGSVRSLSSYSAAALQSELDGALYRPGGPLYADPYATIGFRSLPPASPQKLPDGRDSYTSQPGRGSPARQIFRKDGVVFVENPKSGSGSGSEQLCVLGGSGGDGAGGIPGYSSPLPGNESETRERMEAMEKQIASLTGLVQSVLSRGPDSPEKAETSSDCSATEVLTPSAPLALMPPPPTGSSQPIMVSRLQMQLHLSGLQQSAAELRKQLSQLRRLQLQNQDSVQALLKQTESDLGLCLMDAQRTKEDPLQRQRLLVEEERLRYLNEEELIIQQLHDLERSVEEMRAGAGLNHKLVTEQEVERKSQELRRLGETLTDLKNQFPSLQSKMRVVLRVEVEAVKFLKEEPLRLDALLKRCRSITDTLSALRRQVTEGHWKTPEDLSSQPSKGMDSDFGKASDLDILNSPALGLVDIGSAAGLAASLGGTSLGASLGGAAALANWMPGGLGDVPQPEQDPPSMGTLKRSGLDELSSCRDLDKVSSVEVRLAAERDWEEKRASLTQYSAQDINRLLEETQAELMRAIPDLDFAAKQISKPAVPPKPQLSSLPGTIGATSNTPSPSSTPEHQAGKTQPGKLPGKDTGSRRGSTELTVPRYRTEKLSKSPPPPPPRRSFPSAHGLTTTRTGEVVVTTKSVKLDKGENSEDMDAPPHTQTQPVKLRRPSVTDAPRPASTPPVIAASGVKDDEDEEDKIMAELENSSSPSGSSKPLQSSAAAARLKHLQQSSLERRSRKQREDFPKLQQGQQGAPPGQQQVFHF